MRRNWLRQFALDSGTLIKKHKVASSVRRNANVLGNRVFPLFFFGRFVPEAKLSKRVPAFS